MIDEETNNRSSVSVEDLELNFWMFLLASSATRFALKF